MGFALAYGDDAGGLVGTTLFALKGDFHRPAGMKEAEWMFHWAFAGARSHLTQCPLEDMPVCVSACVYVCVYNPLTRSSRDGTMISMDGRCEITVTLTVTRTQGISGTLGQGGVHRVSKAKDALVDKKAFYVCDVC